MSADTLKEFLVSLGFKVDEGQFRKFNDGVNRATKTVEGLGKATVETATAVTVGVVEMSRRLEDFYYIAQRSNTAVGNLMALRYAGEQIGVSAGQSTAALEGLARAMRTNPGYEGLIAGLGVQTREANGDLKKTDEILHDLVGRFREMPFFVAQQFAGQLGIDPDTLLMLEKGYDAAGKAADDYKRRLKEAGIDADPLAEKTKDFLNDLRTLESDLEIFGLAVVKEFVEPIDRGVKAIDGLVQRMNKWGVETDGMSTKILGIAAALGSVKTAIWAIRSLLPGGAGASAAAGAAESAAPGLVARILTGASGIGAFLWGMRPYATNTGEQDYMRSNPAMYPNAIGGPAQRAIAFFKQAGWSDAQAAGLAANILRESGGVTTASGDGGAAYGIAQWHKDRQQAFRLWSGKDIRDPSVTFEDQLAFMNYELRHGREKSAGDALSMATTAGEAGSIVSSKYLRPGDAAGEASLRASLATRLYGGALGTAGSPGGDSAGSPTVNQETNITIHGGQASATEIGSAVASEQSRVNGNLLRNLKSNVQ